MNNPNTHEGSMAQRMRRLAEDAGASGEAVWVFLQEPRNQLTTLGICVDARIRAIGGTRSVRFTDGSYYAHPHWSM